MTHVWYWHPRLRSLGEKNRKGMKCKILHRGRRMNSLLIEMEDGELVVCSRQAVRKIK